MHSATARIAFAPFPKSNGVATRSNKHRQILRVKSEIAAEGGYAVKGVKSLVESSPGMNKLPPEFVLTLPQSPSSAVEEDIPTINLSHLDGPPALRAAAVETIGAASADWGFFRVENHGVEVKVMAEMMRAAEEFFNLSSEEKMQYASADVMSPVRYGTSLNTPEKHGLHWRDYLRHHGHPFENSVHYWPHNPPQYRTVCRNYAEEIWILALKIVAAISESLGLPGDYIEKSLGNASQVIASNYYPPCPEPDKTLGLAAHSDHGCLGVLFENGVQGLQVKHRDSWIVVPHVPGTFVINLGDYLEILSNGRYKSVEHRATVNAEKARISVGVGLGPEWTTTIGPASPLLADGESLNFKYITYRDYVKHQQTTPVRGKTAMQIIKANNKEAGVVG